SVSGLISTVSQDKRREPRKDVAMHVLKNVGAIRRRGAVLVLALPIVGVALYGAALAQAPRTGGPTKSGPGAEGYFIDLKGRAAGSRQAEALFRFAQYGRCARRLGPRELRPSPSADRYRAAAARSAHSERLQSPAFRRRADRGRGHAQAGRAHVATARGRQ